MLKSFRVRIALLAVLVIAAGVFITLKFFYKKGAGNEHLIIRDDTSNTGSYLKLSPDFLKTKSDADIDSVLYNFGIKKEWISTVYPDDKTRRTKSDKTKKDASVEWFTKYVTIPRSLNTIEINLDLTSYTRFIGLSPRVSEDIRSTDIVYSIYNNDDTSSGVNTLPLARIIINHSDKISRDAGSFVIMLSNIGDYTKDEVDELLNTTNEFTFIYPRNPDDIDVQNKLMQEKRDVILNITLGKSDNYDADFRAGMDLKEIKQKVKSIASDFPSVKTILLSRTDVPAGQDKSLPDIISEFQRYSCKVYTDSVISRLLTKNDEDSKDKVGILVTQMKARVASGKRIITMLDLSYDEFKAFYNRVLTLKKLGYRFYTLSRFAEMEQDRLRKEKLQQEKTEKPKEPKKEKSKKEIKKKPKKKDAKK